MVAFILGSYENLEYLGIPGIYFYFGSNRLALRSGCLLEMGHTRSILPELSARYSCYLPDNYKPFFATTKFSENHKNKIPHPQYLPSLLLLSQSRILPVPEWKLFHSSVSLQLILLANKVSVIFCALYHHLTCLMFTSIMKKFVLSLNGWDLNFLRNIYIWENVYTQNNSTSSGGIRQSEDISATFIQRSWDLD